MRRLLVPGIGPLAATALLAAAGNGQQFRKARDMAAWLGLVPQQHTTGGRTQMLGISKRGNRYVRRLLIHGARSCVVHLDRTRDRLGTWIATLQSRMHVNKGHRGSRGKDRSHCLGDHQSTRGSLRTSRSGDRLTQKIVLMHEPLFENDARGSHHDWLQQQSTRERPDTFKQRHRRHVQEPCTDGADHTFFVSRSFSAALSSMASASSFFSLAFSLSSPFKRLASQTSSPPYLAFQL
jgi:hypothetical protein